MLTYPDIDPVIFGIGPLKVRWYGLMYVLGFSAAWTLVKYQINIFNWHELERRLDNLNLVLISGVILGGRLGYVLFYNSNYYLQHFWEIFATWQGGMSFHGGCLGVILGGFIYSKRHDLNFWKVADIYVVTIPIGLGLGRIGNFLNGELFGRTSEVPWAMVFPGGGPLARHPSQLYEAILEGAVLFTILWLLKHKTWQATPSRLWPHGSMFFLFLIGYGTFRFIVEFFREPDAHLGYLQMGMTMGQLLSSSMIAIGVFLWIWIIKHPQSDPKK